jgi:hypothetical protein
MQSSEVLQGTLDLMVLKTLDVMGPLHGYGIARRIEQTSEDVLQLNEGTVYASGKRPGSPHPGAFQRIIAKQSSIPLRRLAANNLAKRRRTGSVSSV